MTKRTTLTVSAAQYPIGQPDSLDAWEAKVADWVAAGAKTGAELLVFPEYAAIEQAACFGPEVYNDLQTTLEKVAEIAGERVAFHAELAKKHGVHILVWLRPREKERRALRQFGAARRRPQGLVGEQEKIIMTPFERGWGVTGGAPLRVFDTALGKIAVLICYDSEFPLLARALAEAGAEVILVPSCTERVSGYHRVRTGTAARALENTLATVQSPTVGDAPWSPAVDFNVGAAGIFVPPEHGVSDDGTLASGALNAAEWVTATIDLEKLHRVRTTGEMRNFADWPAQPGAQPLVPGR